MANTYRTMMMESARETTRSCRAYPTPPPRSLDGRPFPSVGHVYTLWGRCFPNTCRGISRTRWRSANARRTYSLSYTTTSLDSAGNISCTSIRRVTSRVNWVSASSVTKSRGAVRTNTSLVSLLSFLADACKKHRCRQQNLLGCRQFAMLYRCFYAYADVNCGIRPLQYVLLSPSSWYWLPVNIQGDLTEKPADKHIMAKTTTNTSPHYNNVST